MYTEEIRQSLLLINSDLWQASQFLICFFGHGGSSAGKQYQLLMRVIETAHIEQFKTILRPINQTNPFIAINVERDFLWRSLELPIADSALLSFLLEKLSRMGTRIVLLLKFDFLDHDCIYPRYNYCVTFWKAVYNHTGNLLVKISILRHVL